MRAINSLLSIVVTIGLFVLALEGGLRLLGFGPTATIIQFDETLGWSKTPGVRASRSTDEYDVTLEINELGLRDDPMESPEKPGGTFRVVMLGDSFVQGYTVDREDLFVDQLETWWRAEGRSVDVVNAGTEAWATDQEVIWLQENGGAFDPDLVLLFTYDNDLFWNAKRKYLRTPKPRFHPEGRVEPRVLTDPGPRPWTDNYAVTKATKMLGRRLGLVPNPSPTFEHESGRRMYCERAAYLHTPPEFMKEAYLRTEGALIALKGACEELDVPLYVVPIPNKATFGGKPAQQLAGKLGLDAELWSADQPVDTVLDLCAQHEIPTFDVRSALEAEVADGAQLYYEKDFHLNAEGNRALTRFLHAKLDDEGVFMPLYAPERAAEGPEALEGSGGLPTPVKVFAVLWLLLGVMYTLTYRDEKAWLAPLKVGGLLLLIFTIFFALRWFADALPYPFDQFVFLAFVITILTFVLYKLGHRVGTITELFGCFVKRGHWYLMPLVVVLLTIGSLLVVAASSPLVAPFIYTLF